MFIIAAFLFGWQLATVVAGISAKRHGIRHVRIGILPGIIGFIVLVIGLVL